MAIAEVNGVPYPVPGSGEANNVPLHLKNLVEALPASTEAKVSGDVIDPDSVIGGAVDSLINHPARRLADKLSKRILPASTQQARVVALGDSIALKKWQTLNKDLHRAFGGGSREAGAAIGASTSSTGGTGWGTYGITNNGTTGIVTQETTAFDVWFSGYCDLFATGATKKYGQGGVTPTWDKFKIYYVKAAGAGTFKIQVDGVDEGSTVDASVGGPGLGIITLTRGTVAQREVKIVNLTGTHRIVGVAVERTTDPGIVFSNVSQGGISLDQQTAQGLANLGTFLGDFDADIITLEMKESSGTYAANLELLLDVIDAAATNATFVGIGSTPVATGDADQVVQNAILRAKCIEHGKVYFDGYTPIGSYANLVAMGWEGDGIHVSDNVSAYLAGLLVQELKLIDHPGAQWPYDVNALSVAASAFKIGTGGSAGQIVPFGTGVAFDLTTGSLIFRNASGVTIMTIAQGESNCVMPNSAHIGGAANARLYGSATSLEARDNAGSGYVDFYAQKIIALGSMRIVPVTTGTRPSGGALGGGAMIVNDTTNKPEWFLDGAWMDALGVATMLATKTASYTMVVGDNMIVANGATVTISLPDPTTVTAGRVYTVKNINAASATVNSAGTSKTIDGSASVSLAQWAVGRYASDGTQWLIV